MGSCIDPDRFDGLRVLRARSGDLAKLSALLLVPLSAHALFARPLVLSDRTVVTVEILPGGEGGVVWCDGRRTTDVGTGMIIEVRVGPRPRDGPHL